MTTQEIYDMYQGKFYHRECKALIDSMTDNVPSALAECLRRTRSRCKQTGIKYELGDDITAMQTLIDVYRKQGGRCFYTGRPLDPTGEGELGWLGRISIDRKDSTKRSYSPDNICICSVWSNLQKSELDSETFIELCREVVQTAESRAIKQKSKRPKSNRRK